MKRRRLVFQQRADHFDRPLAACKHRPAGQIQGGIFGMVAGNATQPLLTQAIDQAADPAKRNRGSR